MKEAKADSIIREKIQSLEERGDVTFGQPSAWERLQLRLDEQPVKKKPVTLYRMGIAAALMLLIGFTLVFVYTRTTEDNTSSAITMKEKVPEPVRPAQIQEMPATEPEATTSAVKRLPVTSIRPARPENGKRVAPAIAVAPVLIQQEPLIVNNGQAPSAIVVKASAAAYKGQVLKQQMDVVYIDELMDNPVLTAPEEHPLRIRLPKLSQPELQEAQEATVNKDQIFPNRITINF